MLHSLPRTSPRKHHQEYRKKKQKVMKTEDDFKWAKYFAEYNDKGERRRKCMVSGGCGATFSASTSTSSLKYHVFDSKTHKEVNGRQKTLEEAVSQSISTFDMASDQLETFQMKVLDWVIVSSKPLSLFDDKKFRGTYVYLNKYAILPSRRTATRLLLERFNNGISHLGQLLQDPSNGKLHATFDLWTSRANRAFMGITVHYIDKNWKICNQVLDMHPVPESHTAAYIHQIFFDTLVRFGIRDRVMSTTTDNASNVVAGLQITNTQLGVDYHPLRCAAHVLNLIVNQALRKLPGAIEKIHEIAVTLRRVSYAKTVFEEAQRTVNLELRNGRRIKTIPLDVKTRWNSTFLMLERALELRRAIELVVWRYQGVYDNWCLTHEEWHQIFIVCQILQPYAVVTQDLSGNKYISQGLMLVLWDQLRIQTEKFLAHQDECAREMAKDMLAKYEDYVGKVISEPMLTAAILDPRFNLRFVPQRFQRQDWLEFLKNNINDLALSTKSVPTSQQASSAASSSLLSALSDLMPASVMTEWERYQAVNIDVKNGDPLEWWRDHEKDYSIMSKLAKDYLGMQVTSVAAERLFSDAGENLTAKRSCLGAITTRHIICVQSWIRVGIPLNTFIGDPVQMTDNELDALLAFEYEAEMRDDEDDSSSE